MIFCRQNVIKSQHFEALEQKLPRKTGEKKMENLVLLGIVVGWVILQAWVLPRMGIKT